MVRVVGFRIRTNRYEDHVCHRFVKRLVSKCERFCQRKKKYLLFLKRKITFVYRLLYLLQLDILYLFGKRVVFRIYLMLVTLASCQTCFRFEPGLIHYMIAHRYSCHLRFVVCLVVKNESLYRQHIHQKEKRQNTISLFQRKF